MPLMPSLEEKKSDAQVRSAPTILFESVEGDDMKFPLSSRFYRFVSCFSFLFRPFSSVLCRVLSKQICK